MNIADLKREAESGSIVAQSILGICYLYGRGVRVNHKEAFRLLSAATEKRASRAVLNLARMYAEGLGIPQDLAEAIRLYEAVAKVEIRARLELGRIYSRGMGVAANSKKAHTHYSEVAAREGAVEDLSTAALAGAVTSEEIQEAKDYIAGRCE
jgi:TPR repeat protein